VVPPVRSSFAPRGRERAAPGPWLFNRGPLPALARGEDQVSQVRGEAHFLCMPRSLSPASSSRLGLPPGVSTRPAVVRLAARERGRTHGHLARNGRVPREPHHAGRAPALREDCCAGGRPSRALPRLL